MVERQLFIQFLLRETKFNYNWHLNSLVRKQLICQYKSKKFIKTPVNHELAVELFLRDQTIDVSKYYKDNYVFVRNDHTYVLGQELHIWSNAQLDVLDTKRVGINHSIVICAIPSNIQLLPLVQLARRQRIRISPQMLVQHLVGDINLINQFLNP